MSSRSPPLSKCRVGVLHFLVTCLCQLKKVSSKSPLVFVSYGKWSGKWKRIKEEFMVSCWELIVYGMVSALEFLQCLWVKEVIALWLLSLSFNYYILLGLFYKVLPCTAVGPRAIWYRRTLSRPTPSKIIHWKIIYYF